MYTFDSFINGDIFVMVSNKEELLEFYAECNEHKIGWGDNRLADSYLEDDTERLREHRNIIFFCHSENSFLWMTFGWNLNERIYKRLETGKKLPVVELKDLDFGKSAYKINLGRRGASVHS